MNQDYETSQGARESSDDGAAVSAILDDFAARGLAAQAAADEMREALAGRPGRIPTDNGPAPTGTPRPILSLGDGMVGPAYRVEHDELWTLETRIAEQLSSLDQAALARLVVAIRELQDADAIQAECEPAPMLRSELVAKLDHRRNVFAYVYVPVDGRAPARLGITRVHYLSDRDHIAVYTSPWFLGIEADPPVSAEGPTVSVAATYTDRLPLPAGLLDVPPTGPRWQVLDGKDEHTWHDLTATTNCEDPNCVSIAGNGDPDASCTVLVSGAWSAGFAHFDAAELVDVRIPASRGAQA